MNFYHMLHGCTHFSTGAAALNAFALLACHGGSNLAAHAVHAPVCAGKAAGHYVPQSVLDKEGRVLDVDLVLSEVVLAGDASLTVEYGPGPQAWRVRCAPRCACFLASGTAHMHWMRLHWAG